MHKQYEDLSIEEVFLFDKVFLCLFTSMTSGMTY